MKDTQWSVMTFGCFRGTESTKDLRDNTVKNITENSKIFSILYYYLRFCAKHMVTNSS